MCSALRQGATGQHRPPSTARIVRETERGVTECSLVLPAPLGKLQSSHARVSVSSVGGGATTGGHLCSLPQASHRLSGPLEKDCARHMPQAPKVKHHRKGLSVPETTGVLPVTFVLATALDGSLEARAPCLHVAMQRTMLKEKLLLRQTHPP